MNSNNEAEDISYAAIAARNSKVACELVAQTKDEMITRMNKLETLVAAQAQQINILQHKYDLMLTKNFSGGSTSSD